MKQLLRALAATAVLSLPTAAQVDVAGTWEMTVETPRGEITQILELEQDGNAVTGTAEMTGRPGGRRSGGGFGGGPRAFQLEAGALDGTTITFTIVRSFGDRSMTTEYRGTVDGTTMAGTMTTRRGESAWTAVRVETD